MLIDPHVRMLGLKQTRLLPPDRFFSRKPENIESGHSCPRLHLAAAIGSFCRYSCHGAKIPSPLQTNRTSLIFHNEQSSSALNLTVRTVAPSPWASFPFPEALPFPELRSQGHLDKLVLVLPQNPAVPTPLLCLAMTKQTHFLFQALTCTVQIWKWLR